MDVWINSPGKKSYLSVYDTPIPNSVVKYRKLPK